MPNTGERDFQPIIGTTPFPNFLLDRVMPRLTDTQWRVLCVIVRQTFGWQGLDGTRKKSDWLSHYQLKKRTGRASAAISRAIATLQRAGLIRIGDQLGSDLASASERRRSPHHLVFAVEPSLTTRDFQMRFSTLRIRNSKSENNKRNSDKGKQQQQRLLIDDPE